MKYNHVIFWNDWDLYKQSFSDLQDKSYARYITSPGFCYKPANSLIGGGKLRIHRELYRHPRVAKKVRDILGWRWLEPEYWYSLHFQDDFVERKDIVFVFDVTWLKAEYINYPSYLKSKYPHAKFVLLCFDLWNRLGLDLSWVKATFDMVISFDQGDCKKYDFKYHPLVFSQYNGELIDMPYYDVFFLGLPKNRLSKIISCLEKLWENNVTTDVQMVWVPEDEKVYKDRITYVDTMIPYKTNLQHLIHANCALELMQQGGVGYTQRMCEAIAFDKKIITNNALIHEAPFYNPDYIFQIKNADDITPELCERIKKVEPVDYHYKKQISPIELLEFIEKHLG